MKKIMQILTILFVISNFSHAEEFGIAWETESIFKLPESVIYDEKNDVLYVSNIVNHPFKKDGSGFISKLSLTGEVLELERFNNCKR